MKQGSKTTNLPGGLEFSFKVQKNDLVVCGTDGLFDNVWTEQIIAKIQLQQDSLQSGGDFTQENL